MIDKIINKNLDHFYEDDLPAGHLQRYIKKLDASDKHMKWIKTFRYFSIAATLVLLIAVSSLIAIKIYSTKQDNYLLAHNSQELRETEVYYRLQIQEKTKRLSQLKKIDPETLSSELLEIDASFNGIRADLKNNPDDERIVNAVLSTYQAKIDLLDKLIEKTN
jgi:hypothetical protein